MTKVTVLSLFLCVTFFILCAYSIKDKILLFLYRKSLFYCKIYQHGKDTEFSDLFLPIEVRLLALLLFFTLHYLDASPQLICIKEVNSFNAILSPVIIINLYIPESRCFFYSKSLFMVIVASCTDLYFCAEKALFIFI